MSGSSLASTMRTSSCGSARPLASMTTTSMPAEGRARRSRYSSSSLASTAQHRHPLPSETVESPRAPATAIASISTAPKSLTTAPIRLPPLRWRRWLSRVVFPEPRNPASTTTGICRPLLRSDTRPLSHLCAHRIADGVRTDERLTIQDTSTRNAPEVNDC
ncbi:hypothetical protein SALBM217S_04252 [Streptomyces griseoloalbus]